MMIINGLTDSLAMLKNIAPDHIHKKSLKMVGEKILELSEPKLPVGDGILKSTGTVIEDNGSIIVGYNSEYASYQHEGRRKDGSRIIRNRPAGGESFFLSATIQQNQSQLVEFAKEQIKKLIK